VRGETDIRREPNDPVDDLIDQSGDEVHPQLRENISRVANAIRALAELYLPISPQALVDVAKASKECGVAVKDMLGKGFLTRLLEREVEKRVASDA